MTGEAATAVPGEALASNEAAHVIVRDDGFHPDDWEGPIVEIAPDTDPSALQGLIAGAGNALLRVAFPAFTDGRGFTLARRIRAAGHAGRLRAAGKVLPDQYAMARRSGFDEVEIDAARAERLKEADWRFRADWHAHDYQSRLRG